MLKGFIIFALIAAVLLAAFEGEAVSGTQMVEKDDCNPTGVGFSCHQQGKPTKGTQIVEKDDCNPTGVGFSCHQQGKLPRGLRLDAKKIIIVPPKCPDGKRLDRNGKCKTIY